MSARVKPVPALDPAAWAALVGAMDVLTFPAPFEIRREVLDGKDQLNLYAPDKPGSMHGYYIAQIAGCIREDETGEATGAAIRDTLNAVPALVAMVADLAEALEAIDNDYGVQMDHPAYATIRLGLVHNAQALLARIPAALRREGE